MHIRLTRALSAAFVAALVYVPAEAAAASTTCSTVSACLFGLNTASGAGTAGQSSTGVGVEGFSTTAYGVEGFSKTNDGVVGHTAVNATSPGTGKAGVAGYDDAKNSTQYNSGVYGVSIHAMGVQGRSTYGSAVFALSYKGNAISAAAGSVTYSGFKNVGVVAQSTNGDGMIGIGSSTGVAGFATADCNDVECAPALQSEIPTGGALSAGTDVGGLGLNIVTDTNPIAGLTEKYGVGATIDAGSFGMMISSGRSGRGDTGLIVNGNMFPRDEDFPIQGAIVSGFNAMSVTAAAVGIAVSGETAIAAQGVSGGAVLFQGSTSGGTTTSELDDQGNLIIAGKLTQRGTITSQLRNADGTFSTSYAAHSTMPTVEDLGEATLVSGAAFVPIDAALRKSIDTSRGYLVFLTPQGATSGLYVANKSAAGFSVREIGAAHESIAFDYRIVARPFGEPGLRLASVSPTLPATVARKAMFFRHLRPLRFANGKLDPASRPVPSM